MFYAKNKEILPLCTTVQYVHKQDAEYDFSDAPRPCHNFAFMLEGWAEIETEEQVLILKKGEVLFIPQGTTYTSRWKAEPKAVFHSVHFNFSVPFDPFLQKKLPVQILKPNDFKKTHAILLDLEKNQYAKDENSFLCLAAFYRLCGELLPLVHLDETKQTENPVYNAIVYLENHFTEPCAVSKLAELCFLSPSRFYYLFKLYTGISPIVYKNRTTIRHAAQTLLLEKDKSIETVSDEYGFADPIYFRRLFKKFTKKTPSQYRREGRLI